MYENHEVKEQI